MGLRPRELLQKKLLLLGKSRSGTSSPSAVTGSLRCQLDLVKFFSSSTRDIGAHNQDGPVGDSNPLL